MSLSLGALAAAQVALSLFSQLLVFRIVGIGAVTDAYVAAQAIPMLLSAVVGVSLQNIWLPRLTQIFGNGELWREALSAGQGQAFKLASFFVLALGLTAPMWAEFYLPEFSPESRALFLWIMIPTLLASAIGAQASILVAAMRASGRLRQSEIIAFASLVCSASLLALLVPHFGILVVPFVGLCRSVFVYAVLFVQTGRPGVSFRSSTATKEIARRLRGLMGGAAIVKTTPVVDRYLGAQASSGALTLFTLAQLGISSLATILERSVVAQAVPEYSRLLARSEVAGLRAHYLATLKKLAIGVLAVGSLLLLARPVWNALLNVFLSLSEHDASEAWLMSMLLLPGLFVLAAGSAAVGVFYALGETRIPVIIGINAFGIGLVVKFTLFHSSGVAGLAAGSSIYLAISMAAYHLGVMRRLRAFATSN